MENTPKHIGIIMDGNRRYAKSHTLHALKGHAAGARKLEDLFEWCKQFGVKELTLYAFSIENFKRPKQEVDYLMQLFKQEFERIYAKDKIDEKIKFIGRLEMFPAEVYSSMQKLIEKTKENYFPVNFAMAYDGRAEIVDATKKIAELVKEGKILPANIDEKTIEEHLYLQSKPDLIIRTSGEQRISGFLLWQASYAELYFSKKMWPEFGIQDLQNAITEYSARQRRFGK